MDIYLDLEDEIGFLSSKYASDSEVLRILSIHFYKKKETNGMSLKLKIHCLPCSKRTQAAYVYPYANRLERYALIRGKSSVKNDSTFCLQTILRLRRKRSHLF